MPFGPHDDGLIASDLGGTLVDAGSLTRADGPVRRFSQNGPQGLSTSPASPDPDLVAFLWASLQPITPFPSNWITNAP